MNLDDSLERLFHRNLHIIKLDLEPMRLLMARLGNPQDQMICLHVAGTNGKGSVCAMLASILIKQDYHTGLYTSPHLLRFNERIQVDGRQIDDQALAELITEVESAAAVMVSEGSRDVTFFEFTTALAFLHFYRSGVQVAVIETGMGGRLDATNVITPALSVITSIGLEHTAYLGNTLAEIAGEKAGIIKPGRPVVVGNLPAEAREVIVARARDLRTNIYFAEEMVSVAVRRVNWSGQTLDVSSNETGYGAVKSPLTGQHQAGNVAMAVAAAECLNNEVGVSISTEAIKNGITATRWPARGELIAQDPPVILDGAHNVEAAAALAAWIKKVAGKKPVGLVVGFLSDKEPESIVRCFGASVKQIWIVPIHSDRAMPTEEVARRLDEFHGVETTDELAAAISSARAWAKHEDGVVVITGSLYLAGEVMALNLAATQE